MEPKKPKLKREGSLLKSFRSNNKMDDTVKLRVKKTKLERTPSKQNKINYLTAFIGNSRDSKRQSRESLVERGIIKPASVFGNSLSNMKPDPTTGLPEFLVRATQRIEEFADTVGIYRVNGDGAIVQKIRWEICNEIFWLVLVWLPYNQCLVSNVNYNHETQIRFFLILLRVVKES